MRRVREVIVVEGRYDKNTVAQVVDAAIIETSGFGVFSSKDKLALLRRLAETRGLIILTDPDGAGFFIRGRLRGMMESGNVKHAYIPDVIGREKRKSSGSKEGKLGVEGMRPEVILEALERAGATFENELAQEPKAGRISKHDLYIAGLYGGVDSAKKRREFLRGLDLPERLSTNGMLDVLNVLFSREEFASVLPHDGRTCK